MSKLKQEKKIVFTEEIDSKIDGFTVVITFLLVGILLLLYPNYFGNRIATIIIRWIFIIIGGIGLIIELTKVKATNNIKGIGDLFGGLFFIGIWFVCFWFIHNYIINVLIFFFFLFGLYGTVKGLIKITYSLKLEKKQNKETNWNIASDAILILTKVASFALIIVQIIKALFYKA